MFKIKSRGFTLIELLIVISIIGILSSVVLVNLSSARNRAYRASALATVSGLGTEFIICQDDNLTIAGPIAINTGAGKVCRTAAFADVTSHTVVWPTLNQTGGYVYDNNNNATDANAMPLNGALAPQTFYLTDTDNVSIQCAWTTTDNLQCS